MAIHIRRREFIVTLGGAAAAWPLAVLAQQLPMPVIGFLNGGTADGYAPMVAAFRQGLREAGYVEGQNVAIEFRWAEGKYDRLPALAAELVGRQVAVIAATSGAGAVAGKAATTTTPIVFETGADPVEAGLVASLNRPGGNVTGVTNFSAELVAKVFELTHELVPSAAVVAVLVNPTSPNSVPSPMRNTCRRQDALSGRQSISSMPAPKARSTQPSRLQPNCGQARSRSAAIRSSRAGAIKSWRWRSARPCPLIYAPGRDFVAAGGLMSYGSSLTDAYRQTGIYTGTILNGAKPADLPVLQPTSFELVINLKTAKALGLKVPLTLQVAADEVIE